MKSKALSVRKTRGKTCSIGYVALKLLKDLFLMDLGLSRGRTDEYQCSAPGVLDC